MPARIVIDALKPAILLPSTFPSMSVPTVYRTCKSTTNRLPLKPPASRKKRLYRWMLCDLVEKPLETVSPPALQGTEGHIVPRGLKYLGSYNWTDAPKPTIIVPGQSIVPPVLGRSGQLDAPHVLYRESSDMGGEVHTPDCSPRQRRGFHRPERTSHEEEVHAPASDQGSADYRDPEEGLIQIRLVLSRFCDRS